MFPKLFLKMSELVKKFNIKEYQVVAQTAVSNQVEIYIAWIEIIIIFHNWHIPKVYENLV